MKQIAAQICKILYDYQVDRGFKFTEVHIIKWVSQFETKDQKFILEEFLHLLNSGIYISKNDAEKLLIKNIYALSENYKFSSPVIFLKHVDFLSLQNGENKSQSILLELLDEELIKTFNVSLKDCGTQSKKYALYIDDILATGGTITYDCATWLKLKNIDGETNLDKIVKSEKILIISVFCLHTWGAYNVRVILKIKFHNDELIKLIKYQATHIIENSPTEPGQKMNLAYPVDSKIKEVSDYFDNMMPPIATRKGEYAYRKDNIPLEEQFFSSSQNRIRFENIMLLKGIELLKPVMNLQTNQRPLGITNPSKKTFGTGTLFFTWRNISNTTPIVFWWKITTSNWYPLFPLSNRGKNQSYDSN
jgi:hypothetical protein